MRFWIIIAALIISEPRSEIIWSIGVVTAIAGLVFDLKEFFEGI